MEKMDLEGRAIKCLSSDHGQKIKAFFEANGYFDKQYSANALNFNCIGSYYGARTGKVYNISWPLIDWLEIFLPEDFSQSPIKNIERVDEAQEPVFPCEMWVWNLADREKIAVMRLVIDKNKYGFLVVHPRDDMEYSTGQNFRVELYKHAKPVTIEPTAEKVLEMTSNEVKIAVFDCFHSAIDDSVLNAVALIKSVDKIILKD